MTRIRFQGSLPHAGDSQPFWAPRAKEHGRIFEGSLAGARSRGCEELRDADRVFRDGDPGHLECLDLRLGRAAVHLADSPRLAYSFPAPRVPIGGVFNDWFDARSLGEVLGPR